MKKIFSLFVMICLSLFFIWAVMSWYFGVQAENEFRNNLDKQTERLGEKPFRLELLDYKKHFLGSIAAVRVSSDIPLLNDWLGDFVLNLSSLNGPLFLTKKGIDIGASRWFIRIDPESFSAESQDNLRRIFPETLPEAVLIVGFDKESRFSTSLKTEWLNSKVTAFYNLSTLSYRGALDITQLNYVSPSFNLSTDDGAISFQYANENVENNNDTEVSGLSDITNISSTKTVSIQIPHLTINHQTIVDPIEVSLKGNSKISIRSSMIDTFINLDLLQLKQFTGQSVNELPIEKLNISTHIKGIQQSSFLRMMETKAEIDNLRMQTQWELEEHGEVPEGQDKIWQLQNQISNLKNEYPVSFYNAIFSDENATNNKNISIEMQSSNDQGQSRLKGYLKPSSNTDVSTRFVDLFAAEAQVTLDDLLYTYISNHSGIRKKQFSLSYEQNKLLMH